MNTDLVLIVCMVLFALRVLGQVLVVMVAPTWLPPMRGWQSGILPYPVLLASQVVILGLMGVVVARSLAGASLLPAGLPLGGKLLVILSVVYALGMVARLTRRSLRGPWEHWWEGGMIPTIFHFVLAAFLAAWGVSVPAT